MFRLLLLQLVSNAAFPHNNFSFFAQALNSPRGNVFTCQPMFINVCLIFCGAAAAKRPHCERMLRAPKQLAADAQPSPPVQSVTAS
jgi:hypothetical protein